MTSAYLNGYSPIADLSPELLDHLATVCQIARTNVRCLAVRRMSLDDAAMTLVNLGKLLHEGLDRLRRRGASTGDTADTPSAERTIFVVHGKLATICLQSVMCQEW